MGMYAKYLVCYDIVDNKRRKRFSDALKDLGMVPMQKSARDNIKSRTTSSNILSSRTYSLKIP